MDRLGSDEVLPPPTGPKILGLPSLGAALPPGAAPPAASVAQPSSFGGGAAGPGAIAAAAAPQLAQLVATVQRQTGGAPPPPVQTQQQQQQQQPGGGGAGGDAAAGRSPEPAGARAGGGLSRLDKEACMVMLHLLAKYKEADPFRQPVDVKALNIPDYFEVITTPMDLRTVREKLRTNSYPTMDAWRSDVKLIWDNCRKYNGADHAVTKLADKLNTALDRRMDEAYALARQNLAALDAGEARPRKGCEGGEGDPFGSDSDSGDALLGGGAARATSSGRVGNGALSDEQQRSPEGKPPLKRSLTADGDAAAAAKAVRRKLSADAPAAAAAAVGAAVDMSAMEALVNTQSARQLGATDPDDVAFLALWKRVVARKQQLQRSAGDTDNLRHQNIQLRSSLTAAEETQRGLQRQLRDEERARAAAEERGRDLQRKLQALQAQHSQQQEMLENQRKLLEQQQTVLRKLARQSNQQDAAPAPPAAAAAAAAPTPAAAANPPAAAAASAGTRTGGENGSTGGGAGGGAA